MPFIPTSCNQEVRGSQCARVWGWNQVTPHSTSFKIPHQICCSVFHQKHNKKPREEGSRPVNHSFTSTHWVLHGWKSFLQKSLTGEAWPQGGHQSLNRTKLSALTRLWDTPDGRTRTAMAPSPVALPFALPQHGQGCTAGARARSWLRPGHQPAPTTNEHCTCTHCCNSDF